jgi:DNA polymerase-3 subunit delta'
MHHAWLIEGPLGIGKATLAYAMARFVLAHPAPDAAEVKIATDLHVDPENGAARRIAARSEPGLAVLTRAWDPKRKRFLSALTIDEIRKGLHFFAMTAAGSGWRIAIVDAADDMNVNAANALLKTLEEPPERSLWLIVAHVPGRLPATLRSRCRRLRLAPLGQEDLLDAVRQAGAESEISKLSARDLGELTATARGSVRRALALVDSDDFGLHREILALFDDAAKGPSRRFHALADRLSRPGADEAFDLFVELSGEWLTARVERVGKSGQGDAANLAHLAELWEKIARLKAETEIFHFDRKQVILSIFRAIGSAAA